MGTRNVTIIKFNEQERVRQYGQWDGYPTTALASIVEFLKTDGAIEKLKNNLPKCTLVPEDKFQYPDNFDRIGNEVYKYYQLLRELNYNERIDKVAEVFKVSRDDVFSYYLATRDTGYTIPNLLVTSMADNANEIVLKEAYTNECDWQIEAVNVIDLDTNHITSIWHGEKMEWGFDCLPDDDEIVKFEHNDEED